MLLHVGQTTRHNQWVFVMGVGWEGFTEQHGGCEVWWLDWKVTDFKKVMVDPGASVDKADAGRIIDG
jgi:hypothetical protein